MKQVKIWVMITEPHCDPGVQTFTGADIESCVDQLQNYLEFNTPPGTRTVIVQTGYTEEAVTDGI